MSEMFKRVARAIAKAGGSDLDKLPLAGGPGFGMRQMYEGMARAAIEAMREPTDEMFTAVGSHAGNALTSDWQAMIGAALAPPQP